MRRVLADLARICRQQDSIRSNLANVVYHLFRRKSVDGHENIAHLSKYIFIFCCQFPHLLIRKTG